MLYAALPVTVLCVPQEALKKELEAGVNKVFALWEGNVVQTPSNGGKTISYMVTQSVSSLSSG